MTPKAARNLSAVAFLALFLPCWNLLIWVQVLFVSFHISGLPPSALWLNVAVLAFLPSLALYLYLRRRDFPQICADCAARKPLVWTFFLLFAFFTLVHPALVFTSAPPPPDDAAYFDEDFEVSPDDGFADAEDAPPPTPTPPPLP